MKVNLAYFTLFPLSVVSQSFYYFCSTPDSFDSVQYKFLPLGGLFFPRAWVGRVEWTCQKEKQTQTPVHL